MNSSEYYTPQKLNSTSLNNNNNRNLMNINCNSNSPLNFQSSYQFNPSSNSSTLSTSRRPTTTAGSFHLLPFINTPPSTRLKKVINPFEHALTDRLHLPLICSPSLFKPPSTPKKNDSSSQFEWTIEDVSSLKPANVEPHETQFENSPDPEFEAKAQAAIRSYFKEQLIVPSPIECPSLRNRNRKILLNEQNNKILTSSTTKSIKSSVLMTSSTTSISALASATTSSSSSLVSSYKKRSRNVITQTMLSFPPKLPKEVEKILKKYFISNTKNETETENENNNSNDEIIFDESVVIVDCNNSTRSNNQSDSDSSREVSRKLFDSSMISPIKNHHNDDDNVIDIITPEKSLLIKCNSIISTPTKTPQLDIEPLKTKTSGNVNDVSFCTISPISKLGSTSLSTPSSTPSSTSSLCNQSRKIAFVSSPLLLTTSSSDQSLYKTVKDDVNDITLPTNMSIDISFNNEIEQHHQKQQHQHHDGINNKTLKSKSFTEIENANDNNDEIMQVSILSSSMMLDLTNNDNDNIIIGSKLSTSSSSPSLLSTSQQYHPETPIKRRHPSRKNLSHSFSYHCVDNNNDNDYDNDDDDDDNNDDNDNDNDKIIKNNIANDKDDYKYNDNNQNNEQNNKENVKENNQIIPIDYNEFSQKSSKCCYSTDSGFNEITQSTQVDESKFTNDLKIRCGFDINNDNNKFNSIQFDQNNILLSAADISMTDVSAINNDDLRLQLPQTIKGTLKNNSSPMRCCSTPSSKRANLNFF